ncbi:hypothetical protein HAX54_018890 [Datura stramonium]|uniref:Uncharacterized protein n=1 Tax=Datura stramonium TaxID=4076 RepID=A0ABS8RMR2_DATST|nr:hypothetical protein [Datura stramonium]
MLFDLRMEVIVHRLTFGNQVKGSSCSILAGKEGSERRRKNRAKVKNKLLGNGDIKFRMVRMKKATEGAVKASGSVHCRLLKKLVRVKTPLAIIKRAQSSSSEN